jgi:hypothetical protein
MAARRKLHVSEVPSGPRPARGLMRTAANDNRIPPRLRAQRILVATGLGLALLAAASAVLLR